MTKITIELTKGQLTKIAKQLADADSEAVEVTVEVAPEPTPAPQPKAAKAPKATRTPRLPRPPRLPRLPGLPRFKAQGAKTVETQERIAEQVGYILPSEHYSAENDWRCKYRKISIRLRFAPDA